jgi:hypothetical protein
MNDKALRITSNPQGATGSIEWVIERVNWLDDKPAANMDEATPIRSPIFACCVHRWQFTLKAAFKQKSKVDENKENIMTGFYCSWLVMNQKMLLLSHPSIYQVIILTIVMNDHVKYSSLAKQVGVMSSNEARFKIGRNVH